MGVVEVRSRVVGPSQGDGLHSVFFDAGSERLTVRTIIMRAVEEQVRDLMARKELTHQQALRTFARQYQTEAEIRALRDEEGRSKVPDRARPAQIEVGRAAAPSAGSLRSGEVPGLCRRAPDGEPESGGRAQSCDARAVLKGASSPGRLRLPGCR